MSRLAIISGLLVVTATAALPDIAPAQEGCGVSANWQPSAPGLDAGASVTLDLTLEAEDCAGQNPCVYSNRGYQGDWKDVADVEVFLSWTFRHGPFFPTPTYTLTVEGLGDFEGQEQDGLLQVDPDSILDVLVSTGGKLKVTNTGTEELRSFVFHMLSESMCACFTKTETTKLISWKSATSGDFSTGSNWDAGSPPGSDSTASFNATGSYTVTLSKDVETDAILASQGGTVTLDLADYKYEVLQPDCTPLGIQSDNAILRIENGELSSAGDMVAIGAGSILVRKADVTLDGSSILLADDEDRGSLTISDSARVEVATPGVVDVGADLNTHGGDLVIERAGELVVEAAVSFNDDGGLLANASTGAVRNAGSKLDARLILVGGKGSATLTLTDSALVCASVLNVGSLVGGFGTVDVEGNGTVVEMESGFGRIGIGREGRGFVNIRDGAKVESEFGVLTLGEKFGGDGRLRIQDKDSFLKAGSVKVGVEGEGRVTIEGGAETELHALEIASGVSSSQTSSVTVSGSDTKLNVTEPAPVWIARAGHGELAVLDGATVSIPQDLYVAVNEAEPSPQGPADGAVRVSGADSELNVSSELRVGVRSAGSVTIENSGSASFGNAYVGYLDGDTPVQSRLEVTTGGRLTANVLSVGRGAGVARIRSGARVEVTTLVIGELGSGKGEMQVEDPGSVVNADTAVVGGLGEGLLNTFSGGAAVIGRLTVNNGIVRGNVTVGSTAPKTGAEASADSARGTVVTGELFFNDGAEIDADSITIAGGLLGGTGAFPFPVMNTGVISPGGATVSPGVFTAAAGYAQTPEGVLHIELAGEADAADHDELVVAGTASLSGTLRLTVPRGFPYPTAGATYGILSADTLEGEFEAVDLQEGLEATVAYSDTEVRATVIDFVPVANEDLMPGEGPTSFRLHQNYPNPFNPSTAITYDVPEPADVKITVFDALGRLVEVLGTRHLAPGTYTVTWDARDVPSGVYFYRLEAGRIRLTSSMFFLR